LLAFDGIRDEEIEDFNYAPAEFALRVDEGIITLLIRIGSIGWGNSFYNWWMNSQEARTLPKLLTGEQRYVVTLFLIDRATGILKAMRAMTWSKAFQERVGEEIRRQATHPEYENRTWYREVVQRVYAKYPNPAEMFDEEILVRCLGGN
jgi:hypothetical protein